MELGSLQMFSSYIFVEGWIHFMFQLHLVNIVKQHLCADVLYLREGYLLVLVRVDQLIFLHLVENMVKKDPTNNYCEVFIHTACFQQVKNEPHQVIVHILFNVQSEHTATIMGDCLWVLKSTVSLYYCSS